MSDVVVYAPTNGFSSSEVATIADLIRAGHAYHAIALHVGCSHQRIARVAQQLGIPRASERIAVMSKARDAARYFRAERQRELLGRLATQVEAHVDDAEATGNRIPAKDLRDLGVTAAVLVDKQRLIDGESTENKSIQVKTWTRRALPSPHIDEA